MEGINADSPGDAGESGGGKADEASCESMFSPAERRRQERHRAFLSRVRELPRQDQDGRRQAEREVKRRAVAFSRLVDRRNARNPSSPFRRGAAGHLSLSRSCLKHWRREWRRRKLFSRHRGRPLSAAGQEIRGQAMKFLDDIGPAVSVATLARTFPQLGVCEARRIMREYRELCCLGLRAEVRALRWLRPGAVWAMDHTEPPSPVDGEFPYIFAVRDLASHYQLLAMPQRRATGAAVADCLEELFIRHGAPMVIKSDNAGAFTGLETQEVLKRWGVLHLASPPYLPSYNGAIEAGNGQIQTRAHIIAAQHDRPGRWTSDDLEGARLLGNRSLRPWGPDGPTPEERWKGRRPITPREREELRLLRERNLESYELNPPTSIWDNREENHDFKIVGPENSKPKWVDAWNRRFQGPPPEEATHAGTRANKAGQRRNLRVYYRRIRRESLTDAMVAKGLLVITKREIPLPIKRVIRSKIF